MQPTAPAQQVYSQANNVYNQGVQGGNQAQAQYGVDYGNYMANQQNLQNYQANMPDLGSVYGQNVRQAEGEYGVDPAQLLKANQALAATMATMGNLPEAVQQSGNGRGLTAAQSANRLAQASGNLQSTLNAQQAGVGAYQSSLQNALNQAQTGTGFTGQTEGMRLGALQNLVGNAQTQEQQSLSQIQYYRNLEASGVQLTEGEQNALANAEQAAAAAQSAQAAMIQALNQQRLTNYELSPTGMQTSQVNTPTGQAVQNYQSGPVNYGLAGPANAVDNLVGSLPSSLLNAIKGSAGQMFPTTNTVLSRL